MKTKMLNGKKGFTLAEILVAVMILIVLITIAVPMYNRVIEKSHIAEVSLGLKRMGEAKLRAMEMHGITNYNREFGVLKLDAVVPGTEGMGRTEQDRLSARTQEFMYSMWPGPAGFRNSVCATRLRGDHAGTIFLYIGEEANCGCPLPMENETICGRYCNQSRSLFCKDNHDGDCEAYGMTSVDEHLTCTE